jgi:D-aspartate ligase
MNARSRSAVIVGMDLNGLGVARSLAAARIELYLLDTDLTKPTMRTRFGIKRRVDSVARDPSSGRSIVDDLRALRAGLDHDPVLFLTQEQTVAEISSRRDEVLSAYRITLPAPTVVALLQDKESFHSFSERHGFPVPRSVTLGDHADFAHAEKLRYPCVLKPAQKYPEYGRHFKKAYRVETVDDVQCIFESACQYAPRMILQEWIEGDDSDLYFCLHYRSASSAIRASFVGRKIRQWPPLTGGTAVCVPAPEREAELVTLTNSFFDSCGFAGIGSMEYKYDRRFGKFYMVEPTVGRTDYQEEVAALNGVNIPLLTYCAEAGHTIPKPVKNARVAVWRDPIGEANARQACRDPNADRLGSQGVVVDAYFRWNDPGPWLHLKSQGLCRRIARKMKRKDQTC